MMKGFARFLKFSNFYGRRKTLLGAGAALAGMAAITSQQPGTEPNFTFSTHQDTKSSFLENSNNLPEVKILKKIPSLIDDQNKLDLRLYQFQNCPFCCKVRAFLDYYGFGYEIVEVNSVTKREIKFSEYKKVPIVVAKAWNYKQLNDSSFVISFLRTYFVDPDRTLEEIKSYYPIFVYENDDKEKPELTYENDNKYFVMFNDLLKTKVDIGSRREEREWRRWVDERFVHAISPNIYRTLKESTQTFKWFSKNGQWDTVFPIYERLFIEYVGALVMYFVGRKLKNKYDLKWDVRESLYDLCIEWTSAIGYNRKFMGGDRPNLADLAVYGALTSFEGCQAFQDLLHNTDIEPWFHATKVAVETRLGAQEFGKF